MKKYTKDYAPDPNEWVPHGSKMQWQCCDCALVHNVSFKLLSAEDGKTDLLPQGLLMVKMNRNKSETVKMRKLSKLPH